MKNKSLKQLEKERYRKEIIKNERYKFSKLIKEMPIVTTYYKSKDYPDKGIPLICKELLIERLNKLNKS